MWSAGIGVWWQWKEDRVIAVALNCLEIDDAATTSQELPTAAEGAISWHEGCYVWRQCIRLRKQRRLAVGHTLVIDEPGVVRVECDLDGAP